MFVLDKPYWAYLQVVDESDKNKQKEKKLAETEELSFLLQSGILLCKLAHKIVPTTDIEISSLQVSKGRVKKRIFHLFEPWIENRKKTVYVQYDS